MTGSNGDGSVPYVLLLTNDEAGLTGFPASVLGNTRILVRDLPVERLRGICSGEVLFIPSPESGRPVQRFRAIGTRAQVTSDKSPTALAVITLSSPIGEVSLPESASTPEALEDLKNRFDGHLAAGLDAAGVKIELLPVDRVSFLPADRVKCTEPVVHVGLLQSFSLCDWLGIGCPDD